MLKRAYPRFFWVLSVIALVGVVPPTHAQSNGQGTIYSRFGLGSLQQFSSPRSQALGGGGFALRSLNYNPDANPALWSDQVYTRLLAGASFRSLSVSDGDGNTSRLTSGNLKAIQFSFPLYERKLGVGLSFQPYSRSNYNATLRDSTKIGPQKNRMADYRLKFTGSGGLQRLRGGLGYRINERWSVGASADFLWGIIESRRRTTWPNTQALGNVVVSDGVQLSGLTGTLGIHLALADVFSADDALSVGASVTLPATLSGERYRTLGEDLARDTLTTPPPRGEVELPPTGRLGLSYQPGPRWTFVADGLYAPWSSFSSTFSGGKADTTAVGFAIGGTDTLTDRWRVSLGAEVVPAGEERLAGYFAQVAYRFGAYAEHMYVRPTPQTDLYEFGVTAGVSFPTSLPGTRIDLNTVGGTRGKTSDSLVRDFFVGVSLHVNFGERWFQRRKLR
ncbi:MAG: hypothetical protein ABEL51_00245 [Salinibacter sp.]